MNQVATKKEGALATNLFEADANKGAQNISQEDLALPFLKILGQLSPEVNKRDGKYVEGAEPGKIINTVTNELYDEYTTLYLVITKDNTLSGRIEVPALVHLLQSTKRIVISLVKPQEVKTTKIDYQMVTILIILLIILYLLVKNPTTALISMKATQLKVSRKWNSMMMGIKMQGKNGLFTPPTYSHIYKLKTVQMSNDKGTWFGWDVAKVGPVEDKTIYDMAKNFCC